MFLCMENSQAELSIVAFPSPQSIKNAAASSAALSDMLTVPTPDWHDNQEVQKVMESKNRYMKKSMLEF